MEQNIKQEEIHDCQNTSSSKSPTRRVPSKDSQTSPPKQTADQGDERKNF